MNWDYIAGYSDGEGCLLIDVTRDKRAHKTKGSLVDGWAITPAWAIQTYDYDTLGEIYEFLVGEGFSPRKLDCPTRGVRQGQTKQSYRVSVGGWRRLEGLFTRLIPLSRVKRGQYQLFSALLGIVEAKGQKWDKQLFIAAMTIVDNINALKSRNRGFKNANYFRNLWQEGGDAK